MRPSGAAVNRCSICGDARVVAKDRCGTCYEYARRNGTDRTHDHIARLTQRDIEREATRRRGGR